MRTSPKSLVRTFSSSSRRRGERRWHGSVAVNALYIQRDQRHLTGVAMWPYDLALAPREPAERLYDVERYTVMPKSGHFPAWEVPELYMEEPNLLSRELTRRPPHFQIIDRGSWLRQVGRKTCAPIDRRHRYLDHDQSRALTRQPPDVAARPRTIRPVSAPVAFPSRRAKPPFTRTSETPVDNIADCS